MKQIIGGVIYLCIAALPGFAQADEQLYLQTGALLRPSGDSFPNDIEAGLAYSLPWQWNDGRLTSKLDIGLGFTDSKSSHSLRAIVMPLLHYQTASSGVFVEAGIGLAYLSNSQWGSRHDLGSHLQFEQRLGIGYDFGNYDLSLNITHLSNGGLKDPNPGAETASVRFAHNF